MDIAQANRPVAFDLPPTPIAQPRISSDFETFLRMLTAQMKNQDPLNPVESSDFATQLATFSGVEQAVLTNDLLRALSAQMGVAGMADLASWVGKEVRAPAPAYFDGAPVTLHPNPMAIANAGEIIVRDAGGAVVQRFASPATTDPVQWNGIGSNGVRLPNGVYSFAFASLNDGQLLGEAPVETYNKVTEVRSDAGQASLIVIGGITIPARDVKALRASP
ncbi:MULTISPECIES: flagellar hook capping FlgD N-terminal domain-containing protein [unclassified Yoonia]|uniref:flagellar hook capping FlgD N-terminal domain-containing protein n=1 Tax=unclassified Yoonia TaxID=2629118 RepID=UPI002AFE56F4|nr:MULTISPECIES: flagellar hook capping FlgD N-terminal domain-containing protein [unclassified Yoonia]